MNDAQKRKKMIAKIKIAQKELAIDDATYRDMLFNLTGKNSSTQLNMLELNLVCEALMSKGFVPKTAVGARPIQTADNQKLMNKLEVLLKKREKTWKYAEAVAMRMFKSNITQLDARQLRMLCAAFVYYDRRQ